MKKSAAQKRIDAMHEKVQVKNREQEYYRARSVTVGTAFGGTIELSMRNSEGFTWCILQPVEVVELINQMAAGIGCHIAIKPRNDFSSWREWKIDAPCNVSGNGWPPFADDMAKFMQVGANLPAPQEQPGMQPNLMARSTENVMATEKPKNRRSTKRTAKAS